MKTPNYEAVISAGEMFKAALMANGGSTHQGILTIMMQVENQLKVLRGFQASAAMPVYSGNTRDDMRRGFHG